MIKLCNLSKYYNNGKNKVKVLDNINLDIREGELVAIIGKSGSGKSTLLNILSGLINVYEGEYLFYNHLMNEKKESQISELRNKYIGYVVQDYALINDTSIYNNVKVPTLYNRNLTKAQKNSNIISALKSVGLLEKKGCIINEISGGECQRVAIARAIVNNKNIILADEPTGALDEETGNNIIDLLINLNKIGKTIILVTHNKDIAQRCNRIIELKDGIIMKDSILGI